MYIKYKKLSGCSGLSGPKVLGGDGARKKHYLDMQMSLIAGAREMGGFCCLFPLSF